MSILAMIAKSVVKKGLVGAGYQVAHGMSPREYLKSKLQAILRTYDRDGAVTYELIELFAHGVSQEDLEDVAYDAGVRSILKDIFPSDDVFAKLFESSTYDFIVNYFYYTEELGKTITKSQLDNFFDLMRKVVSKL